MKRTWIHVAISCPAEVADELAARIADSFQVGVEVSTDSIQFYLEQGQPYPDDWERSLSELLGSFQKEAELDHAPAYTQSRFLEQDWMEGWKSYFKPLRVGRRFLVCPTWEQIEAAPSDRVITMDPGRAFGTGHHETTRLCLEWLERWAEESGDISSRSLLDVGTGSGILAIGAALLGCGSVVGIDVDPEAIEVAEENVGLNGPAERVQLHIATASDVAGTFDVVIANIQAFPLIEMAPVMAARSKPGGTVVLSGILVEQQSDVQAAYEAQGMEMVGVTSFGEWCLLFFRHRER